MKAPGRIAWVLLGLLLALVVAFRLLKPETTVPAPAGIPASSGPSASGAAAPAKAPSGSAAPAPAPRPRTILPVREEMRRAARIVDAYFKRRPQDVPADVPSPQDYATNLPVGWFQLLVRAFPDEAFEVYSAEYLGDPARSTVAYWALGELARLRHEPTFHLFNGQLEGNDPVRTRRALKALAHYELPQLGPRILAVVPRDPRDADDAELVRASLATAASTGAVDRDAMDALIDTFDRRARDKGLPDFYGTQEARLRAGILRDPDPVSALKGALILDTEDRTDDLERAEWAADRAVRGGHRALVPAIRQRIETLLKSLEADERLDELDVLGRRAQGRHDLPNVESPGGLEEVRALAVLRKALHDLGGELSAQERAWLDGLRLLRSPREYLVEAGLVAP